MRRLGCSNVADYLLRLDRDPRIRSECERLMTVSISRFFRDRRLWEVMKSEILPHLINKCGDTLKVWSAGCASGEEVYSLKIIWDSINTSEFDLPELQITATDLNSVYLRRALSGVYSMSSLKEVPEEFRTAYFEPHSEGGLFALNLSLKRGITWLIHDFLSDPPKFQFDLIFLRNSLLTYYREDIRNRAFQRVAAQLSPHGFLIIGSHERLPAENPGLHPFFPLTCVFTRGPLMDV